MMGLFGFCFELWAIVILTCLISDRRNTLMGIKLVLNNWKLDMMSHVETSPSNISRLSWLDDP